MTNNPENFIVSVHPDDMPDQSGLGVIVDGRILTCAHHRADLGHGPLWTDLYRVQRIHDGQEGTFAAWLATSMDFMVLDDQPMGFGIEDGDLFAGAVDVTDCSTTLHPAKLDFSNPSRGKTMAGFFFAPDGSTRHHIEFSLYDTEPMIDFSTDHAVPGTSGGPVFLEDGTLIGLVLGQLQAGAPSATGRALRIDLAAPLLVHKTLEFETKAL